MSKCEERINRWWRDSWHSASGFSLVEIIIAMVLLALLMLSTALMFSRGKAFIRGQSARRVALTLAQEGLEIVNSMAFTTVEYNSPIGSCITESPPLDFNGNPLDGSLDGFVHYPDYSDYQRETCISYVMDDPITTSVVDILEDCNISTPDFEDCDYLRIQVTVSSTKTAAEVGYVDEVSLETIISRWR